MIAELKKTYSVSNSVLARQFSISYTTLMRWKRRLAMGQSAVNKPGPKKVEPLDLDQLKEKIQDLNHGEKRSHATGRLYAAFNAAISRRELNRMVTSVRNENKRLRAAQWYQIIWLKPNLAWAIDDCQKPTGVGSDTLHLHNLSDLCSRYKFHPLASTAIPCDEEVAGHLSHLFSRFDAPLLCKRENGAIEHTQSEFKKYLRRWEGKANTIDEFVLLAETAAHELNHKPRRCLKGQTACRAYFDNNKARYHKRQRKSIYNWIRDLAAEISVRAGKTMI